MFAPSVPHPEEFETKMSQWMVVSRHQCRSTDPVNGLSLSLDQTKLAADPILNINLSLTMHALRWL